jgi:hypothetical protein
LDVWENLGTATKGDVLDTTPWLVTHAATVWWPSKAELNDLQRTACLGITGAMRTAPTAAVEVLLGLPSTALAAGG